MIMLYITMVGKILYIAITINETLPSRENFHIGILNYRLHYTDMTKSSNILNKHIYSV